MNDIKQKLFQPDLFDRQSLKSLMKKLVAVFLAEQDMHSVMEKFDDTHSWYLYVLNTKINLIGFISKRNCLVNPGQFLLRKKTCMMKNRLPEI